MLIDFRPNLKPAKAQAQIPSIEIEELLKKGDLLKAGRLFKRSGLAFVDFGASFERWAKKLWHERQLGVILSFMEQTGWNPGIDPVLLLRNMVELHDWHGFLKNAYRLKIMAGLEGEIDTAIERLMEQNQLPQANAWKRKFGALLK